MRSREFTLSSRSYPLAIFLEYQRAMAIENTTGSNEFATIYTRDSLANDSCQEYDCPQSRVFKIIVIGDSNVGKTCLTYRFCGGKFLKNPEATIGVDFRERTLQLDGENIKVRIRTVG